MHLKCNEVNYSMSNFPIQIQLHVTVCNSDNGVVL